MSQSLRHKSLLLTAVIAVYCCLALGQITGNAAPLSPKPLPSSTNSSIIQPGDRSSGQSATALTLAESGKAVLPIVIATNASNKVKDTAAYLAARLEKITGAQFEVQQGDGKRGIVLGTWQQFPVPELKKPLEVREAIPGVAIRNGEEAYGIRSEAGRLLLLGGGEGGVGHAAARFLEMLGYRQFYPAPEWEVVPSLPTLTFKRNETDRPTILTRNIWHPYGMPHDAYTPANVDKTDAELTQHARAELPGWAKQNRYGESFHIYNAHNYYWLTVGINQKEFEDHPEYYGLFNGKREPGTICDSNPEVRRLAGVMAVDYLKKYAAEGEMFSMEPHDGDGMCTCEKCRAVGSYSDRAFAIANEVARALQKELPGKMVGMLAYNQHDVPPPFAIEPNIHVCVCRLFLKGPYPFRELIRLWHEKTPNVGIYDYFATHEHGQDRLRSKVSSAKAANLAYLKDFIPYAVRCGVLSFSTESSIAWGVSGRGNYLAGRLMWNPDVDTDALLHDFYAKAFGPAAAPMRRYYERVDGQNDQMSGTLLGLAMRDVDEAAKLAKDRPDVTARIDQIKQFLYYNYLQFRMLAAKDVAEGKPWVFKLLQHEYRTRNTYMTHWHGTVSSLKELAATYNEPTWNWAESPEIAQAKKEGHLFHTPPWVKEENYSHEETEAAFQEAMAFFQPKELLPAPKYSRDLVPVDFGRENKDLDFQNAAYQEGKVYLYSLKGEPIEIDLIGDKTPIDAFYALADANGKELSRGTFAADSEKHHVKFQVPQAGLYVLSVTSHGWWLYTTPAGASNTISLEEPQTLSGWVFNGESGRNFFYVPRGTKQIQFYWGGEAHQIFDASGAVAAEIPEMSDYITIPVPDGKDGTVWSFNKRQQPRSFVNIPNYISPSPQGLLVPRELAIKDGLNIRK